MASGPHTEETDFIREVTSSRASSQPIGTNLPAPLGPVRLNGVVMRLGEWTCSGKWLAFWQIKPSVKG